MEEVESAATTPPQTEFADTSPAAEPASHDDYHNYQIDYPRSDAVRTFFAELERRLGLLISAQDADLFPPWQLPASAEENWGADTASKVNDHICAMSIPTLHGRPSMLLQRLGKTGLPNNNSNRNNSCCASTSMRTLDTISPQWWRGDTVFMDTSGSGKTRTLLETLCTTWGLYFVCSHDPLCSQGSTDLQTAINESIPDTPLFKPNVASGTQENAIQANRIVTHRAVCQVILSRFLVLKQFVALARKMRLDIAAQRKRWLILQLCPHLLDNYRTAAESPCPDIFEDLVTLIREEDFLFKEEVRHTTKRFEWSLANLQQRIRTLSKKLNKDLSIGTSGPSRPFCVALDEVQTIAESYPLAFFSWNNSERRSVLREVLVACITSIRPRPAMVMSGAGVKTKIVKEVTASRTLKPPNGKTDEWYDLGCYTDPKEVERYMRRYIPPVLRDMEEWKCLVYRCGFWLRGRFRFAAAFVQLLLRFGFRQPHFLLNRYIDIFTDGFIPSDAKFYNDGSVPDEMKPLVKLIDADIGAIDFDALLGSDGKAETLASIKRFSLERFIYFNRRDSAGLRLDVDAASLVEKGIVRYGWSTRHVLYDEPLVHVAFDQWMRAKAKPNSELWKYVTEDIEKHGQVEGNGFEKAIAVYLAHQFSNWNPLGSVFWFLDGAGKEFAWKEARLVTYFHTSDHEIRHAPVSVPFTGPVSSPSHVLGLNASTDDDVAAWFKHERTALAAPFCFPTNLMGPDVMFFLEIRGEGIICVALQAKWTKSQTEANTGSVTPSDNMKWFVKVTPGNFYESNPNKMKTAGRTGLRALNDLPRGLNHRDMPCNVFRVVAVFPEKLRKDFSIKNWAPGPKNDGEAALGGLSKAQYRCQTAGNVSAFLDPAELRWSTFDYPPRGILVARYRASLPHAENLANTHALIHAADGRIIMERRRKLEKDAQESQKKRIKLDEDAQEVTEGTGENAGEESAMGVQPIQNAHDTNSADQNGTDAQSITASRSRRLEQQTMTPTCTFRLEG